MAWREERLHRPAPPKQEKLRIVLVVALALVASTCERPPASLVQPSVPAANAAVPSNSTSSLTCDDRLWAPIYSKDRLQVISPCEVETGTVEFVELEPDGDLTIHMRPDHDRWLGPGNVYLDTQTAARAGDPPPCGFTGCLQIEVPCQGAISQIDAMGTCVHFAGRILGSAEIPRVGQWIAAAAHLVEDRRHHNWRELHGAVLAILSRVPKMPAIGPKPPPA